MRALLLIPLFLVTAAARGQDSPAGRIVPYLTDDAVAVGRVDLAAVNVDAAFDRLAPFLAAGTGDADAFRVRFNQVVGTLRDAGVEEVFAVLSPTDLPQPGPYLIFLPSDRTDVNGLLSVLRSPEQPSLRWSEAAEVIDGAIFTGPKSTLDRLKARREPQARPELSDAFAAVGDSPVQVAFIPSEDHRRVLREMSPDLPPDFGGATGERLAAGLRWAAIGVSFEPKLAAKVAVQGESDEAAEALKTAITAGLRRLSTTPEVVATFPAMPLFVGSLIPKREGDRLVLVADETLQAAAKLFGDVTGAARKSAYRLQSKNNLKQIGLAFHNFHDVYGGFPPSAGYDGDKPLLSWRVYMLPWLEQGPLYNEFRLDEPWDSEHNKKLIDRMPAVFESPTVDMPPGHTVYLAPTGEGLTFGGKAGMRIHEIKDGTSNTVLVVEATAGKAVPWTKPDDLAIDPANPLTGLIEGREAFDVLFGDGSVRSLPTTLDPATFLKLLTPAGGEPIDNSQF